MEVDFEDRFCLIRFRVFCYVIVIGVGGGGLIFEEGVGEMGVGRCRFWFLKVLVSFLLSLVFCFRYRVFLSLYLIEGRD